MKKKYINFLCYFLLIISFLFSIYQYTLIKNLKNNLTTNDKNLDYNTYEELFKYLIKNIDVPNFSVKASTLGNNISKIDKDLSFNKREYITLTGKMEIDNISPTEEQIILENKEQEKQITIGILYTNSYLGNDLVGWLNNQGFSDINSDLASKNNSVILTYKNLIISINQCSTNKIDIDTSINTVRELIHLLKSYFDEEE